MLLEITKSIISKGKNNDKKVNKNKILQVWTTFKTLDWLNIKVKEIHRVGEYIIIKDVVNNKDKEVLINNEDEAYSIVEVNGKEQEVKTSLLERAWKEKQDYLQRQKENRIKREQKKKEIEEHKKMKLDINNLQENQYFEFDGETYIIDKIFHNDDSNIKYLKIVIISNPSKGYEYNKDLYSITISENNLIAMLKEKWLF